MANEMEPMAVHQDIDNLYANVREILSKGRQHAYTAVNFAMVESYWQIGQSIMKHEQ